MQRLVQLCLKATPTSPLDDLFILQAAVHLAARGSMLSVEQRDRLALPAPGAVSCDPESELVEQQAEEQVMEVELRSLLKNMVTEEEDDQIEALFGERHQLEAELQGMGRLLCSPTRCNGIQTKSHSTPKGL